MSSWERQDRVNHLLLSCQNILLSRTEVIKLVYKDCHLLCESILHIV